MRRATFAGGLALAIAILGAGGVYVGRHGWRGALGQLSSGAGDLVGGRRHARRPYVGVGGVTNNSGVRGADLAQLAQQSVRETLASHNDVTVSQDASESARGARQVARGHFFDGTIQSIVTSGNATRVSVSIVVSSYPGREYEFESASNITISGGSGATPGAQDDAVRAAMASAANRAVGQLLSM